MKDFRTEISPERPGWSLMHNDQTLMIGSCFAEHIGTRLKERFFQIDLNPFGVLFNPVSIAGGLQRLINGEPYKLDDLFVYQGLWHSFDHHSRFSGSDPVEVLDRINMQLLESSEKIRKTSRLFITLGTASVYHYLKTGRVVSNCHQVPAGEFQNQLLRVGDIVRIYTRIVQDLLHINPDLKLVFTVSPVRYWKDGPNGNQISKATLILAVSELVKDFDQISYFPAYEIFMDDLRDYRFYDQDLLHPGMAGISYTWRKFEETYLGEETLNLNKKIEKLQKSRNHRPRNPDTEEYQDFLTKLKNKAEQLQKEYPELEMGEFNIQDPL